MKRSVILIVLLQTFLLGFNQIQQRAYSYKPSLHYDSDRGEFIISQLPQLPKASGVKDTLPYYQFLILTGDGNYQMASTKDSLEFNEDTVSQYRSFPIKYNYLESGDYEVEVYFFPAKTSLLVPSIKQKIRAIRRSPPTRSPQPSGASKWGAVVAPFGNEFVPGDTLIFPIHVRTLGSNSLNGGFLFFACNGKKDEKKTGFPPFKFLRPKFNSGVSQSDLQTALNEITDPNAIKHIKKLQKEYGEHLKVFKYDYKQKDQGEHIVFSKLIADQQLEYFTLKKLKFNVIAVVIPNDYDEFTAKEQHMKAAMTPGQYKDPNIKEFSLKTAYYKKNDPKEVLAQLQFQNVGKDPVSDLRIVLILSDNLSINSIEDLRVLIGSDPVPRAASLSDTTGQSYYIFDRYNKNGKPEFLIKNVSLAGTKNKEADWEQTIGEVLISVKSNNKKNGNSSGYGKVFFGKNPDVETKKTTIKWREKNVGIMVSTFLQGSIGKYKQSPLGVSHLSKQFGIRISKNNFPFRRKGWGKGWELGYSKGQYIGKSSMLINGDNATGISSSMLTVEDTLALSLLEALYKVSYHFHSKGSVTVGLGGFITLNGKHNHHTRLTFLSANQDTLVASSNSSSTFGLFSPSSTQQESSDIPLFGQPLPKASSVSGGILGTVQFSYKLTDHFSLVLRQEVGFSPSFLNNECGSITRTSAALSFRIARLSAKGKERNIHF